MTVKNRVISKLAAATPFAVVLPVHNECSTVGPIVASIIRMCPSATVIVVDDASEDESGAAAFGAGAVVLTLPLQLGAWLATQTGLRFALELDLYETITMDADGQHIAEAIPVLRAASASSDELNVVIGAAVSRSSLSRRVAWSVLRSFSGLDVSDLTSGFRSYDRNAMELLASEAASHLEYQDVGVLSLIQEAGMSVAEIEVEMKQRSVGRSRIFYSWRSVFLYMFRTLLLGISKRKKWPLT